MCHTIVLYVPWSRSHAVEAGKLFAALDDHTSEALVASNLGLCQASKHGTYKTVTYKTVTYKTVTYKTVTYKTVKACLWPLLLRK